MANAILKEKLNNREFFSAPGVFDMMSMLMANRVGFDCVYASGYWLTASYLGLPDAGLATYTDMLNRVTRIVEMSDAPVIADADTGFGGLLNVQHTVRGYENAGVSGIQIEDQEFPKKCGHTPHRRVVPLDDMLMKLEVAMEARVDTNLLVIARTDCRTGQGIDAAIERAKAFARIGVDIVFVESLESKEEMRRVCEEVPGPLLANMADGGKTPILSTKELQNIGYACAIFPAMASLAAIAAVESSMRNLKYNGTSLSEEIPMFDFQEFCREIGFEDVWEFEKRWHQKV